GARISVEVGVFTMLIAASLGVAVGSIAGYFGGMIDGFLMRFVDLLLAIPFLFVILVAARFFGGGDVVTLILIFGLLSWPGLARLVRAMFLSLREMDFVQAARAVGVSDLRIAFRHILPNALGPIVVSATLIMANAIVLEAFVSFLNFGIRATDVSWGNALSNSQGYLLNGNWWWPFFPGMAIAISVISVNFMGDGLRDALDPRQRRGDDLPGADDQPEPGLHGGRPDHGGRGAAHQDVQERGLEQGHRVASTRRHQQPRAAGQAVSARAVGRHAPARDDRDG